MGNKELPTSDLKLLWKLHKVGEKVARAISWPDIDRAINDKYSPIKDLWEIEELKSYFHKDKGAAKDYLLFEHITKAITDSYSGRKHRKSNQISRAFNIITNEQKFDIDLEILPRFNISFNTLQQGKRFDPFREERGRVNIRTINGRRMAWREPPDE